MAKYTKAQVDSAIALILDNSSKAVTPAIVRGVLAYLRDMEQLASYIKFTNATLQATTAEEALAAIAHANIPVWNSGLTYDAGYTVYWQYLLYVANINIAAGGASPDVSNNWILVSGGDGGTMTAGQIKAALETLTLTDRLNASAINGLLTDADQLTYDDPTFGTVGSALNFLVLRQNMDYSQVLQYKIGYLAFYNGKLYRCLQDCVNVPPTSTTFWQLAIPGFTSVADFVGFVGDTQFSANVSISTGDTLKFDERCLLFSHAMTYKWEIQEMAYGSPIVTLYKKTFDFVFDTPGNYNVKLSLLNSSGALITTKSKESFVNVTTPVANFTVYHGISDDAIVLEAEMLLGTSYNNPNPLTASINWAMTADNYPWFAAPATHDYLMAEFTSMPGWFTITSVFYKSPIYIKSVLYTLYIYKSKTRINGMNFKTSLT